MVCLTLIVLLLLTGCSTYPREWEHKPREWCYNFGAITIQLGNYDCPDADMTAPMPTSPNDKESFKIAGERLLKLRQIAEHNKVHNGKFDQWDWGGLRLRISDLESVSERTFLLPLPPGVLIAGKFFTGGSSGSPIIMATNNPYMVGHELHHALLHHMSPATMGAWHGRSWMER